MMRNEEILKFFHGRGSTKSGNGIPSNCMGCTPDDPANQLKINGEGGASHCSLQHEGILVILDHPHITIEIPNQPRIDNARAGIQICPMIKLEQAVNIVKWRDHHICSHNIPLNQHVTGFQPGLDGLQNIINSESDPALRITGYHLSETKSKFA
jgi:hypothetical protein